MGSTTIAWTNTTWNPVVGCTRTSAGCDRCYAATMTRRLEAMGQKDYAGLTTKKHFNGVVRMLEHKLSVPLHWKKPRMVFVNSMSDLFHKDVSMEFQTDVFEVMAKCPQHTFQILTKRADQLYRLIEIGVGVAYRLGQQSTPGFWPLKNVWLGVSVEDQEQANARIPWLLKTPAAVRFLSCEPLLSSLDIERFLDPRKACECLECGWEGATFIKTEDYQFSSHGDLLCPQCGYDSGMSTMISDDTTDKIGWVIGGGESGPKARPCNVAWLRSLQEQCKAAGVPYFNKQLGANVECRNDEVSDWLDECPTIDFEHTSGVVAQGELGRMRLKDKKGADPAEWPSDLRVQEFPA